MRIFELLNQNAKQPVNDPQYDPANDSQDQPGQAAANADPTQVDQNLEDLAQQAGDENAAPEPQSPTQPPELDDDNVKPVDDALLAQVKHLPYTSKYDFDDNSPLNPIAIMQMQPQDLSHLRNQVRYKMQVVGLKDQIGLDDNRMIEYCNDLLRFIDVVSNFKKTNQRTQLAQTNPLPTYQNGAGA